MRTPLPSGRQVAYSLTRSVRGRTTVEIRHSRMGFPILPQLSPTAEFFVIDLIAQHNPEPDSKFPCGRDPGLAHSFLDELATVESFQLRIVSYGMHRRFGPQIAQQRVALLGHVPQPLSLPAAVLTGNHPDIAGNLLGGGKAAGISQKHLGRKAVTGPTP